MATKRKGNFANRTIPNHNAPDDDGFESISGGGQGLEVGEQVEGVYGGIIDTMPAQKKGQPPIPFYAIGGRRLLGGTVLQRCITEGKVKPGDILRVTRLEDATAKKGRNAAKLYDVRVKRMGKRGSK